VLLTARYESRHKKKSPHRISSEALRLPKSEYKERKRYAPSLQRIADFEISQVSEDDRFAALVKLLG
jgi:hypothetical protein